MVSTVTRSPLVGQLPDLIGEVFPHSRPDTRRSLMRTARLSSVEAGRPILRQGDDSSIALVLEGHVALRRTTADGRQLIMNIVTRGGLASMLSMATSPASADAIALTPTHAALWLGVDVRSLATVDSGLAIDILDHVLRSLEDVVGRFDGLIYQDASRRVARVLLEHADLFFSERPVLTRAHLPSMVGTSREMTGRVLRLLEARGLVSRVGRNRLRLLDPAGLTAAAELGPDQPEPARRTDSSSSLDPRDDSVRVVRRDARAARLNGGRRSSKARSPSGWSLFGVPAGPRD